MPEPIDLTGKKFGYLSVLHFAGRRSGKRVWACKCDCGKEVIRDTYYLTHQSDVSCGCVRYKKVSESKKTHGQCGTKLYKIWEAMKRRCDSLKQIVTHDTEDAALSIATNGINSFRFMSGR